MYKDENIKITVEPTPYGKKWTWIEVKNHEHKFLPSFRQWYFIIRSLVECERDKYRFHRDPGALPRSFFIRCFELAEEADAKAAWKLLQKEFDLPERGAWTYDKPEQPNMNGTAKQTGQSTFDFDAKG